MDEQLPIISEVWDPVVAEKTRSRLKPRPLRSEDEDGSLLKRRFRKVVLDCFEDLGGYARFVAEMNNNYLYFVKHGLKPFMPQEEQHSSLDVNITIKPAIAPSPLDGEYYEVQDNGRERTLDKGNDQASWGTPQGTPCTRGSKDTLQENGESRALVISQDT